MTIQEMSPITRFGRQMEIVGMNVLPYIAQSFTEVKQNSELTAKGLIPATVFAIGGEVSSKIGEFFHPEHFVNPQNIHSWQDFGSLVAGSLWETIGGGLIIGAGIATIIGLTGIIKDGFIKNAERYIPKFEGYSPAFLPQAERIQNGVDGNTFQPFMRRQRIGITSQ